MFSQRVKYHKGMPWIDQTSKFLLSFYNNTRCNKISQMAVLRMDWYSLISIHKSASRGIQIFECLLILDHRAEMLNYKHLKPYLNKGLTAISKLQYSLLAFWRFSKSLKICKSEPHLINITGTFYDWCHLITDFKDAVMHQLPVNPQNY